MQDTGTIRKPQSLGAPSGQASLRVRERYLRRRSQRRSLGERGLTALWLGIGALVSWLFVVGFAALGH
ncbi:MAG TPA: hypothetical protein VG520_07190 [Candidatus Dormibacteraeota bacterium]|jgi:hypothetical protein|nr:hypothetical protein [Candidatus Dormibacteraeota bacterium]